MIADPSDKLHRIIVDDVHRFFDTPNIKPRALLFCLFVDFWLGTLVFGPLMFMAFRGSWQCWDFVIIMLGGCGLLQSIMTTLMGCLIMTLIVLTNIFLQEWLKPDVTGPWYSRKQILFFIASRSLVLVSVSSETLLWKGMWELLDLMRLKYGWQTNVYLFFVLTLILLATKSFNICHCSPLGKGFTYDISGDYLKIKTALQLNHRSSVWLHGMDAFLTVLINLMTASVYHCLWTVMEVIEEIHFRGDEVSSLNLVIFATVFSMLGFLLQFPNLYVHATELPDIWKLISHEVMLIVTLVADVVVFYTVWDLLDTVILTSHTSSEISALRKLKISGTDVLQEAVEEFSRVREHSYLNTTTSENCRQLQARLASHVALDLASFLGSFVCLVIFRVSSTIICGVKREGYRFEDGIMVPRYYLTYILSTSKAEEERTLFKISEERQKSSSETN